MATSYDGKVVIATELDTKQAKKSAQGLGGKLKSGLATGAKVTGKALGVVTATATATAGAMVKATKATMEYGVEVNRNSQKLNMSKKGYQEWSYVLKRSGTSIDSLRMGMKKISTQIDEARNGSKSATENFKRLGLSVDDLKGKSQEEVFGLMVKRLQGIKDTTERSAIANKFFGRSAQEMAGLLNKSGKDVEGLKKQAHDLGLVLSDDAIKKSAEFRGKITELQSAFEGLRNKMAVRFLPALTNVTDGLSLIAQGDTDKGIKQIEKGVEEFTNKLLQVLPKVLQLGGSIIKALATSIINNLPTLVSTGTQIALTLIKGFISMLPTAITMIIQSVQTLLSSLSAQLPSLLTTLVNGIFDALILLLSNVPNLIRVAISFVTSLVDAILQAIPVFIERLPEIIGSIVSAIISSIPLIISGLIKLVTTLVTRLPEIILGIIEAIPKMITQFFTALKDPEKIKKIVNGFVNLVKIIAIETPKMVLEFIKKIPSMIKDFCSALVDEENLKKWVNGLKDMVVKLVDKMPEIISNFKDWVLSLPSKIASWLKNAITNVPETIEKLKSVGKSILKFIKKGLFAAMAINLKISKKIIDWIKGGGVFDLIKDCNKLGKEIAEGIIVGMLEIAPEANKFGFEILEHIKDFFIIGSPSKLMRDKVGKWVGIGLADGIVEGYEKANPFKQINANIMTSAGALQSQINASLDLNNNIQGLAGAVVEGIANSNLTVKIGEREMGRVVRSY